MDFGRLRTQARELAEGATNQQVKELARIVEKLCDECADLEKAVVEAQKEAHRAKVNSKKA